SFVFCIDINIHRVVLYVITSIRNVADLLWIESPTPDVAHIKEMVDRIREEEPTAKLVYNNSPSFNWTLNFRQQTFDQWVEEGKDVSAYDRARLMAAEYDGTALCEAADLAAQEFKRRAAAAAGAFHHLVTLPTYQTAALT